MPHTQRKALRVSTEINIHAVSCPGVWLPGRGRIGLSVCLLGFHTRTNKVPPSFPLLFHEKFKYDRTFVGVTNLSVLEKVLEAETIYLELVQEETSGETVLAVFESSVRDILFPKPAEKLSYSGVDLDLLMEPTRDFPGIISPKMEVSTRTSITETRTPLHQCEQDAVSFGHANNANTKAVFRPVPATKPNTRKTAFASRAPEESNTENKGNLSGSNSSSDGGGTQGPAGGGGGAGEGDWKGNHQKKEKKSYNHQEVVPTTTEASLGFQGARNGGVGIGGLKDDHRRPPFAYRRPEDNLLSNIPPSPKRHGRYLGIRSRYLSRSAGNLTDLTRTPLPSRYGTRWRDDLGKSAGSWRRSARRLRSRDDLASDAYVTEIDSETCPHCSSLHGVESCTTCRTYNMYFPRPLPHAHAHSYHAHAPHARLKVLTQPSSSDFRRRKRYLAELGNEEDDSWDDLPRRPRSPPRRPISAPPDPQHTPDGHRNHSSPERGETSRTSPRGEPESPSHQENRSPRSPSRSLSPPGSALHKRRSSSSRRRSHGQRYSLDSDDSPEDDFASDDEDDLDLDYDLPLLSSGRYKYYHRRHRVPGWPCPVCGLVCSCVYCMPPPRRSRRRMVHF